MIEDLSNVVDIVRKLNSTTSTKEKENIIRENANDDLFRKVLTYVYDKDKKFGIRKASIKDDVGKSKWNSLFEMLDELSISNINNELKLEVAYFLNSLKNDGENKLVKNILLKDLRIGVDVKTVNKAIPGLIVTHDIMLGSKWDGNIKEDVAVSLKLDGVRVSFIVKDGKAIAKSRQGKVINGMDYLNREVERLANGKDLFIDGELLAMNTDNLDSKELFKLTSSIVNSKGEKKNLTLVAFDILPLRDYETKTSCIPFKVRRKMLEDFVQGDNVFIDIAPLYFVTNNPEHIQNKLSEVTNQGLEGLMLNKINGVYEFKRSKNLQKVKAMSTMDLRVIGFEEGVGKNEGTLGAIITSYKGNIVKVGSGFSDDMRNEIWNNKDMYLNKIAEIQYFEITENAKGSKSLRFPVFLDWRFDKNEESYD